MAPFPRTRTRSRATVVGAESGDTDPVDKVGPKPTTGGDKAAKRKTAAAEEKVTVEVDADTEALGEEEAPKPAAKRRKTSRAAATKSKAVDDEARVRAEEEEEEDVEQEEEEDGLDEVDKFKQPPKKSGSKAKPRKAEAEGEDGKVTKPPAKGGGRSKGKKAEAEAPLVERTVVSTLKRAMYIGAHVSAAGGVHNSVINAVHVGANAFALFLRPGRKWDSPAMTDEARTQFRGRSEEHGFEVHKHCLPHASYLINLAAADPVKAEQAYGAFLDDLRRCEALGIGLYNFHPGNSNGERREEAIGRIAAQLNRSHRETSRVVTVLENMAGQGNQIGSQWEDLRDIISQVEDKTRVGVCIDTCHAFAAGHDLRTPAALADTMAGFEAVVGLRYLRALHVNDSKAPLGSRRDVHANIGTGFLGLRAFHAVVNYAPFQHLPMVLETPIERRDAEGRKVEDRQIWADEIKLLERLVGMDADSDELETLHQALHAKGTDERERLQGQADRRAIKDAKKATKAEGKATGKASRKTKTKETEEAEAEAEEDGAEEAKDEMNKAKTNAEDDEAG